MRAVICVALYLSACVEIEGEAFEPREAVLASSEGFESGSKSSYATGDVVLTGGAWRFTDALIGTLPADAKIGARAARVRQTGRLTMLFDVDGATTVSVAHASYGSDASSTWQLFYSQDGGGSWTAAGAPRSTTSTLATASFALDLVGPVRFELRKLDGGANRIDVDDFAIAGGGGGGAPPEEPPAPGQAISPHTALGLPSSAGTNKDDFLSVKAQYVLSYNGTRKNPRWVSWELNAGYLGSADRQDNYRVDDTLPSSIPQATPADYSGSGWDRGHMCPSGDRTLSKAANGQTFYLSNMVPQATNNNGGPWARLETYSRTLAQQGKQLYIVSGGIYGSAPVKIGNGVHVPDETWKVVVVAGGTGPSAVTTATRVIAVRVPNRDSAVSTSDSWQQYRVSVDSIEAATGLDLLSDVPPAIESVVEARVDDL